MLIVLTGPSAAGKDAVISKFLQKDPSFTKVITTTDRPPRSNEVNGKDYHFVSTDEFENLIKENKMLEYVKFAGSYYGTTKEALQSFIGGKNMLWKVEITRGAQIEELFRQYFPNEADELIKKTLVIYLDVPSHEILRERLINRGTSEEETEQRLRQDEMDWEKYKERFQNIVINYPGKLEQAVEEIENLLTEKS